RWLAPPQQCRRSRSRVLPSRPIPGANAPSAPARVRRTSRVAWPRASRSTVPPTHREYKHLVTDSALVGGGGVGAAGELPHAIDNAQMVVRLPMRFMGSVSDVNDRRWRGFNDEN